MIWAVLPSVPAASARNVKRMGTQMPSFRPLSTFRLSRTGAGTASFVMTASPSAASVGASIVARIATVRNGRWGKRSIPVPTPSAMVNGRPISSMPLWNAEAAPQGGQVGVGGVR